LSHAHIDKYFHSALEKYRDITYYELHGFLTELLTEWYDKYPPAAAQQRQVPSGVWQLCALEASRPLRLRLLLREPPLAPPQGRLNAGRAPTDRHSPAMK
jgi:hypothetical protein